MKTAVHFGAGNIGRGFIAPILQENEYEVTFIDINSELIEQINNLNKYKITSLGLKTNTDKHIENVNGIDLNDNSKVTEKIAEADLITTSVGPKFVSDIFTRILNTKTTKQQSFIAFENMYRASTSNSINSNQDRINLIDAVVDKIIPPQKASSLDVSVEEYGSIILDEETNIKPLNQSEIVSYKNYENEFYKKLWLLNGLHLKLAYFGLSQNWKFIHEVMQNEKGKIFASESVIALAKAYKLYSKTDENLEPFSKIILDRFSLPELQDEIFRVARNPEFKFAINERFEFPLRYLISEDEEIKTFKIILDIIFNNNFDDVEGFNNFKLKELSHDKKTFYDKFWKIDTNIQKYTTRLGE